MPLRRIFGSKTMRVLILTMLALLTLAPLAAAQEDTSKTNETQRPDDAAWVEDCPPDMMCAAGGEAMGPEDCIDCTRGPADGSCEYCRGEEAPSGTCMDGADTNETCDPDVMYFGDGPADSGPIESHSPAKPGLEPAKSVPGASFALVVAAFALAIFLLARRG